MASISVDDMRCDIAKVYPGYKWKRKVQNMSDNQVIALYYKFLANGKFDEPASKQFVRSKPEKKEEKENIIKTRECVPENVCQGYFETYTGEQLSFDFQ